jgi:hypothetical protein
VNPRGITHLEHCTCGLKDEFSDAEAGQDHPILRSGRDPRSLGALRSLLVRRCCCSPSCPIAGVSPAQKIDDGTLLLPGQRFSWRPLNRLCKLRTEFGLPSIASDRQVYPGEGPNAGNL